MELNVSQLLMEPSGSSREYQLDDPLLMPDRHDALRVLGTVAMMRTNKSIWVSAELRSALECECGRCLTGYSHPIQFQLEEEYIPSLNPLTGARVAPPSDGSDYYLIDDNHILDLTEPVREYVVMADPMKPLCRPDCAGLCAGCGSDLNYEQCDCEAARDARWGPLLELISGGAETD
jgi:uncharacterized protein